MGDWQKWHFELGEYVRQGEPEQAERSENWQTAIGLQKVDGLQTSDYLLDTAKEHVEGNISIDEAQERIQSYYEEKEDRKDVDARTKEADIVSSRITQILGEKAFHLSPVTWMSIHRRLFEGVFEHAGEIRTYNITKKEWVLEGESVTYTSWESIAGTLDYDFRTEREFSYEGLSLEETIRHLAKFASDIWQIHPFAEGNTRATAVFVIQYLKMLGFEVDNTAFQKHSWYFRNALVRANYNNTRKGVRATTKYLELFFSNLLAGTEYELRNLHLHLNYGNGGCV